MEIRFRGVIALSDEPLRRAVCQQTLDFRPKSIQFAFARPFGSTKRETLPPWLSPRSNLFDKIHLTQIALVGKVQDIRLVLL
jgi:hypothetical protein